MRVPAWRKTAYNVANSGVPQGTFPALQASLDRPADEQEGTQMFGNRIAVAHAVLVVFGSAALLSQPPTQPGLADLEFPATMRQNVTAGVTAVGTRVQAKLAVATLVKGTVIPQNAILSGEVTESQAKSNTEPSRLTIRMDSAQWKNGSLPIKAYLTAWIYPLAMMLPSQDPADISPSVRGAPIHRNGGSIYSDPNAASSGPTNSADDDPSLPKPDSGISKHRVLMKNVESTRDTQGIITLTSRRSTIKLDKQTTYVFAAGGLLPMN
jgi:hypothetical protein